MELRQITDKEISNFLVNCNLNGNQYNYYIYGSEIPYKRWGWFRSFFSVNKGERVIVNFSDKQIAIVKAGNKGSKGKPNIKTISNNDILDISLKNSSIFIEYKIKIEYKNNQGERQEPILIAATKIVTTIKKQTDNLKGIKKISENYTKNIEKYKKRKAKNIKSK